MQKGQTQGGSRRAFVKKACLAGLCACGARAVNAAQTGESESAPAPEEKPATMPQKWIVTLLPLLAGGDQEYARRVLKGCSASHYEHLKMQATLEPFIGKLPAFLDFLRTQWGWIIEHDRANGVITINENKSSCVCPLVPKKHGAELGILCYCSEGFAEKMFSAVVGAPVRAEVTESILRGGKRCRYRIELRTAPT
ncbi:MAG: hypothetical protein JW993_18705 [Sedimentisphaerales bacterium]|nr:hypothetical protein [Sedimentisphaerales bacterium]